MIHSLSDESPHLFVFRCPGLGVRESALDSFLGWAAAQCGAETIVGGLKTAMDFVAVYELGFVDLVQ
jgi:hypothetical protein